ncbi:MAG: FKBP-type peptidyl-prolyl cis-trans isomerase [Phocaeicola sp.]|uniref:FKBP-type peptidyl-prolyl cis-trans isomerase n=1 Tax=Phocaeicola sp. TaxID=2773926 RepID=UPI003FA0BF9D
MKKGLFFIFGCLLAMAVIPFSSCKTHDEDEDLYANWQTRNENYIDSIAAVAKANNGTEPGTWKIVHTYKFPGTLNMDGKIEDYVYCKILEKGNGAIPLFTDTVSIAYIGKQIHLSDGTVRTFDATYSGQLNKETVATSSSLVSGFVTGFSSALLNMAEGDHWMVYIPYQLGYGKSDYKGIKGYSTLIFDLYLANVRPLKGKK